VLMGTQWKAWKNILVTYYITNADLEEPKTHVIILISHWSNGKSL
jgi:hypothetical protein